MGITRLALLRHWLILSLALVAASAVSVHAADEHVDDAPPIPAPPPQFFPNPVRIPETMQRVAALEFSPDGKYLASAHGWYERSGSLQVWEVKTGKRVALQLFPIGVSGIGWAGNGKELAVSTWDSTVRVFAFPSLQEKTKIGIDRSVARLAVSPDGKQIVTAAEGHQDADVSGGRVVQIWDAASGELVRRCDSEADMFRLGCAAWSPQGKFVAAGGGYYRNALGLARLWFADTGKEAVRLEGHTQFIRAIRFFPDESRVATGGLDNTVRLWDTATGKMEAEFKTGWMVDGLDVSPDGKLVAGGTAAGEIILWSPDEKRKVADLVQRGPQVLSLAFARDGQRLAAGGGDGVIRLYHVAERRLEREFPAAGDDDRPGHIDALKLVGDGQTAVIGYDTGILRALDLNRRANLWKQETGQGRAPSAIAVSVDQKLLLVGYEEGTVRLHTARDGVVLRELKKMPGRVTTVAFSADDSWLGSGDLGGRVWLYSEQGKVPQGRRQDHRGAVLAIGFAEKSSLVTSIGNDASAIVRKTLADEIVAQAAVNPTPISSARVSGDGTTAVVVGQQVTVWDAVRLMQRSNVRVPVNTQTAPVVSFDGSLVVAGHALGTSMFDGRQEGVVVPPLAISSRETGILALSMDKRTLLQGTTGGVLLAWRAAPQQVADLGRIRRVGNAVALATSPDGKWLAAGGDDSQITIWNLQTGEIEETLPGGGGTIYTCQFSADGRMLATGTLGGTVKVWRVKDWLLENALLNPRRFVRSLAFSSDGRWLAIGGSDRSLVVADTSNWENVVEMPKQDLWVEGLAFSPDGTRLFSVTGSWDGKDQPVNSALTAWKLTAEKSPPGLKLESIKKVEAHTATTDNLVATPDGRHVVTGSAHGEIKVWDAKTLEVIQTIRTGEGIHRLHLLRNNPSQVLLGTHRGGVAVWNLQTGQCLATYAGHTGHVFDVSASPDGRLLISAGEDDAILFWPGPDRGPDEGLKRFLKRVAEAGR